MVRAQFGGQLTPQQEAYLSMQVFQQLEAQRARAIAPPQTVVYQQPVRQLVQQQAYVPVRHIIIRRLGHLPGYRGRARQWRRYLSRGIKDEPVGDRARGAGGAKEAEALVMLSALLDAHEAFEYDDQDREYIRKLKSRISKTRAELRNMGSCLLSDE